MEKITPCNHADLYRIREAAQNQQDYEYICAQVKSGHMEFFKAGNCYFVTCLEMPQKELVIVCCQGKNLHDVMDAIRASAKRQGYKTIRIHLFNKSLIKHLSATGYNWQEAETIYKLGV